MISVVLPVYNSERYLRAAVESVLAQSFEDFELLAIDDGSTDGSFQILKDYPDPRIRLFQNEKNSGVIYTLNRGIHLARGEWIARMDSDDVCLPNRFQKQMQYLISNPSVGILGTNAIEIDEDGNKRGLRRNPSDDSSIRWDMLFRNPLLHPTVMVKRDLLQSLGGYSYNSPHAEDYDLWARATDCTEFANVNESLLLYRVNSRGVSTTKRSEMELISAKITQSLWEKYSGIHLPLRDVIAILSKKFQSNEEKFRLVKKTIELRDRFIGSHPVLLRGYSRGARWGYFVRLLKLIRFSAISPRFFLIILRESLKWIKG